jgi:Ca2+/Na+ antiporter
MMGMFSPYRKTFFINRLNMITDFLVLSLSAATIVAAVRYLLVPGIGQVSAALKFSIKTRGQMIGYATSIPELTMVVAGAIAGVFDAGMWNIAASNIVNWALFLTTVFIFRQQLDLVRRVFVDELLFGLLSVAVPLALCLIALKVSYLTAAGLIALFVFYKYFDRVLNRPTPSTSAAAHSSGSLRRGSVFILAGVAIVLGSGAFLGNSANVLVGTLNVPAWAVGWLVGLITSVCEFASFIAIYRVNKRKDGPNYIADTQEALDALVASNIANLGLILPFGMIVYLLVHG